MIRNVPFWRIARVVATILVMLLSLFGTSPVMAAGDRKPPTQPSNLRLTSLTSYRASLAWNPSTDNSGTFSYKVVVSNGATYTLPQTQTTFNYFVAPNGTYSVYVYAVDGSGNKSTKSNTVSATPPADTTAPTPPQRDGGRSDGGVAGSVRGLECRQHRRGQPAALGDLVAVGAGPFTDGRGLLPVRGGAGTARSLRGFGCGLRATRTATAAVDPTGAGHVSGKSITEFFRVVLAQIDLVRRSVKGERNGSRRLGSIKIVHESDGGHGCHASSS